MFASSKKMSQQLACYDSQRVLRTKSVVWRWGLGGANLGKPGLLTLLQAPAKGFSYTSVVLLSKDLLT